MSNTGLKGITRVDSKPCRMHGYLARVQWRGVRRQKWFGDSEWAEPQHAIIAAILWRDQTEADLGKPRTEKHVRLSGFIPWLRKRWVRRESNAT